MENCYIIEGKGNAVLVDTARLKYRDRLLHCRRILGQGNYDRGCETDL